jgi:hypothetical protein
MPGAVWVELRCKHIPDRDELLVRCCRRYSNSSRGMRADESSYRLIARVSP